MGFTVLIPQDIAAEGKKYLTDRGYEIRMGSGASIEAIKADVVDCDAILARTAPFPKEVIEAGKKLKVIARHGVGVDNIDCAAAAERGIWVTNAPESNSGSVAEYAVGMLIALARDSVRCDAAARAGDWEYRNRAKRCDLEGKTLGIVGAGRIGSLVARKARFGLDMKILAYDPFVKSVRDVPDAEIVTDIEYVFKNADFISLHLPALAETKKIVDRKLLGLMKPSAYLVNAARGEVVNEEDIYEFLKSGRIAGAGLDVLDPEPPRSDNPLLSLQNVILSPHTAALTAEATLRMALHAARCIDEVLSGKAPSWPVNKPKL